MKNSEIHKLESMLDDPRFEGFAFADDEKSFRGKEFMYDDFLPENFSARHDWKAPRLAGIWKPVKVIGRVRRFNDYPTVEGIPAFSQRAVNALRDILETNGELLPVISTIGTYYIYNVTTVADVLDAQRSRVDWLENGFIAGNILHYEFHPDRLRGLTIFRIPEVPNQYYVTEAFLTRVRTAGLHGFHFRKVWPWPAGTVWWQMADAAEARERSEHGKPAVDPRAHTVVIRLRLAEGTKNANKMERQAVARMMDNLDDFLLDVDAPAGVVPVGSLEGHEYVEGECRLFLSCADADALVETLRPTLERLDWPGEMVVLKRYGEMHDKAASESVAEGDW